MTNEFFWLIDFSINVDVVIMIIFEKFIYVIFIHQFLKFHVIAIVGVVGLETDSVRFKQRIFSESI